MLPKKFQTKDYSLFWLSGAPDLLRTLITCSKKFLEIWHKRDMAENRLSADGAIKRVRSLDALLVRLMGLDEVPEIKFVILIDVFFR